MVLLGEPAFPGRAVTARPVGLFWLTAEKGPDAKVLAVPARDPRYAGLRDLGDVPGHLLDEIGHFFDIYTELEPGKGTDSRSWQDRAAAETVISESWARARTRGGTGLLAGQVAEY